MTIRVSLFPPIDEIRQALNVGAGATAEVADIPVETAPAKPVPLPPHLRQMIAAQQAANTLPQSPLLAPGNIVALPLADAVGRANGVQIGCLLDAPAQQAATPHDWQGWPVAGEADYAGPWDVLLEEEDEPHDQSLAMVQTWNPCRVHVPADARVIGRLSPTRLEAIRAVAQEAADGTSHGAGKPLPGRVGMRTTAQGHAVLTGHPYLAAGDPRTAYVDLYREAATRLGKAPASRPASERQPSTETGWWGRTLVAQWPWLGAGAMALLVAAVSINVLMAPETGPDTPALAFNDQDKTPKADDASPPPPPKTQYERDLDKIAQPIGETAPPIQGNTQIAANEQANRPPFAISRSFMGAPPPTIKCIVLELTQQADMAQTLRDLPGRLAALGLEGAGINTYPHYRWIYFAAPDELSPETLDKLRKIPGIFSVEVKKVPIAECH